MEIRPVTSQDRPELERLVRRIETFSPPEVSCALELIDASLAGSPDYQVLVAVLEDRMVGWICYGPTPMTDGTADLYWIASDPEVRGKGIGAALVSAMEGELRRRGVVRVRVETSASEAYGPTRGFYQALRYLEVGRFPDFYKVGDDLITLGKKI